MHKTTDFHKAAVSVEKKATYCKLCRKQLTSIVQMQDHLESRPHRDKMDLVKERQREIHWCHTSINRTLYYGN